MDERGFMAHIIVISTLPSAFPGILSHGIVGVAMKKNLWSLDVINLYDFGIGIHKKIDDTPYGGGAGMVIMADVLGDAIRHVQTKYSNSNINYYYMSPRGEIFNQNIARNLSDRLVDGNLICIICGRFEGIDSRVIDFFDIKEISLGRYVLSNGEIAAMTLIDAVVRLLPDAVGNQDSLTSESFSDENCEVLEYDQYTKPATWNGISIPEVLLSGHHENIKKWRKENSLKRTNKPLKKE